MPTTKFPRTRFLVIRKTITNHKPFIPPLHNLFASRLPLGSAATGYKVFLCVNIYDKYLSFASSFLTVTVTPPEDKSQMLSNMEQSILGKGGSLEEAVKQQNAQLAFQDSITASSVLKDTVC